MLILEFMAYFCYLVFFNNFVGFLMIFSYKHISKESKEVLSQTFSHLLSAIDYNFSSTLHEKIELDKERKKLLEKNTLLDQELDRMKIVYLEERSKEEISSLSVIAEQTSLVLEENTQLRATLSSLEKE